MLTTITITDEIMMKELMCISSPNDEIEQIIIKILPVMLLTAAVSIFSFGCVPRDTHPALESVQPSEETSETAQKEMGDWSIEDFHTLDEIDQWMSDQDGDGLFDWLPFVGDDGSRRYSWLDDTEFSHKSSRERERALLRALARPMGESGSWRLWVMISTPRLILIIWPG